MARRLLHYGMDEWDRLAWHKRKTYMNGLIWEIDRGGIFPPPERQGGGSGGAAQPQFEPLTWTDRAALGITVIP